ncbi:hypothetical protein [Paracoccus sp. SSJ]|uniref:hypothetical protein n=1 Tax=Paracoccus sp. SSJ TaxID=3050636 RepID=UPI00254C6360|nr:hypothetical protein [Paracoccus sp. SSJ]
MVVAWGVGRSGFGWMRRSGRSVYRRQRPACRWPRWRDAVNANLIFKWLRDPRYAPDPASAAPPAEAARFLPVEIVAETRSAPAAPAAENHIEIELAGGHRMRISGSYDPEALARLIRGLSM